MSFKLAICFLLFIGFTSSWPSDWQKFKHDYNKQYASPAEEVEREQIFLKNVNQMKEYQRTHPDATFTMGVNHLTDRRVEELVYGSKSYLNIRSVSAAEKSIQQKLNLPDSLDWRDKNVISSVLNQGQQPKAVAIAAVEVIESYHAIQTQTLERGSVAQVSTCCPQTFEVFDCILSKLDGGICRENDYNTSITICDPSACQPFAVFNNIKKLPAGDEETMLTWIQDSTLFVSIHAGQNSFQLYKDGIYGDTTCSQRIIDHSMQLVGYGIASGKPYWLCKNSWGTSWGKQGYIMIERGKNICGIAEYVRQIEYRKNDAVRSFNINHLYLALFCSIVHVFSNSK